MNGELVGSTKHDFRSKWWVLSPRIGVEDSKKNGRPLEALGGPCKTLGSTWGTLEELRNPFGGCLERSSNQSFSLITSSNLLGGFLSWSSAKLGMRFFNSIIIYSINHQLSFIIFIRISANLVAFMLAPIGQTNVVEMVPGNTCVTGPNQTSKDDAEKIASVYVPVSRRAGALVGFILLLNLGYTLALKYLNPLGKPQAMIPEESTEVDSDKRKMFVNEVIELVELDNLKEALKQKKLWQLPR
ncbi:hypothetical protein POM88_013122 [Heracleum sosnowskyi]|uniref:Plant PDR ABC transporter associated domain-containing protein n=1 Tax=Heracleum sosnowskyi TaxID=360622 RepID=A0AAD8N302_9APIA|nr:hypothetical protein POM88_013122 [Heracleum sosnowskyi]